MRSSRRSRRSIVTHTHTQTYDAYNNKKVKQRQSVAHAHDAIAHSAGNSLTYTRKESERERTPNWERVNCDSELTVAAFWYFACLPSVWPWKFCVFFFILRSFVYRLQLLLLLFLFWLAFSMSSNNNNSDDDKKRERTTTCKQYLAVVRAFENRLEFVPLPLSLYSSLNYSVIHQPQLAVVVVVRLHFTFRVFGFFSVRFLLLFVFAGSSVWPWRNLAACAEQMRAKRWFSYGCKERGVSSVSRGARYERGASTAL